LGESGRFNWNKAFQNDNLIIDYGPVSKANATIDETQFHTLTPHTVSKSVLAETVKELDMADYKDGIGVSIVIEAFDNNTLTGYGYIVFFDIATRELLHKQSVSGKAFGVTLFTYWAKAILGMRDIVASRVLRDVQKKFK
jgi:hypothetical protein